MLARSDAHGRPADRAAQRWRRLWLLAVVVPMAAGCSTIPISGRKSFNLIPDSQANALGADAFNQIESQSKLIRSGRSYDQVVRVGHRIAAVAEAPDFQWKFALIDEPKTVNAFCLPGGKVAVYSGLLPITRDDGGLAVVLAHEVGHAIARHGSERMTDDLALQLGGAGLQQLIQQKSPATQQVVMTAFGVGAMVGVMLPFSRAQESEADRIGLVLMARAGYDPLGAPEFWRRMVAASSGGNPPQFLSDHPSDESRIRALETWMPDAVAAYRPR